MRLEDVHVVVSEAEWMTLARIELIINLLGILKALIALVRLLLILILLLVASMHVGCV